MMFPETNHVLYVPRQQIDIKNRLYEAKHALKFVRKDWHEIRQGRIHTVDEWEKLTQGLMMHLKRNFFHEN